MTRWFLKCRSCKVPWAMDTDNRIKRNGYSIWPDVDMASYGPCPHCGENPKGNDRLFNYNKHGKPHKVMGMVKQNRLFNLFADVPCDGRCTNATGPNCDCSCNGHNHGTQRIVEKSRDAGSIPPGTIIKNDRGDR